MSRRRELALPAVFSCLQWCVIMLFILVLAGISTCSFSCTAKKAPLGITVVKVYFSHTERDPCLCDTPVVREMPKRVKIEDAALFALKELTKGPTKQEQTKGYGGCLPTTRTVGTFKKFILEMVKAHYEKGETVDKRYLNSEGKFTPWGDKVKVKGVTIKDGVAYADFSKELYSYGGGSCFVWGISSAINNTLRQFHGVEKVVILIEGREAELEP